MVPSRRRLLVGIALAALVAGLAWLAFAIVPSVRIDATTADGRSGLQVAADLPAATCRKTFTATFPWVRIACEQHPEDRSVPGDERESGVPHDLDRSRDTE